MTIGTRGRASGKARGGPRGRRQRVDLAERLAEVARAAQAPADPESRTVLAAALADGPAPLCAAAAAAVARSGQDALVPELAGAFERLMRDPVARDPGCRGKTAIVVALLELGAHDAALYRRGIRHVQKEPAWGEPVETAAGLRAQAALGLVRCRAADATVEVALLLADEEAAARAGAAAALGEADAAVAVPLLRYKIAAGDEVPEVTAACVAALLTLSREAALPVAAALLHRGPAALAEAVALAVGESRLAAAQACLVAAATASARPTRPVIHVALALLRSAEAFAWLVARVASAPEAEAEDALRALAHFRADARLREPVRAAAAARPTPGLEALRAALWKTG